MHRFCTTCGTPIYFRADRCPKCKNPDPFGDKKNENNYAVLLKTTAVIVAIIGAIIFWFVSLPELRQNEFSRNFFQKQ